MNKRSSRKSYQIKDVSMRCLLCGVEIVIKDFPFYEWERTYCCYECYSIDITLPEVDDEPVCPDVKRQMETEESSVDVYNEDFDDDENFNY